MDRKRKRSSTSKFRPSKARATARAVSRMLSRQGGFNIRDGRLPYNERKFLDTSVLASAVIGTAATTWNFNLLNGIAQGTDANNRIGRVIKWNSLNCRMSTSATATMAGIGGSVRILLIVDKQNNGGALPSATDVFVNNDISSLMNLDNRTRFHVLYDKYIYLGPPVASNGSLPPCAEKRAYIRKQIKGMTTVFNGTGSGIGTIISGSLLLAVCQNGGLAGTAPIVGGNWRFRLRFHD